MQARLAPWMAVLIGCGSAADPPALAPETTAVVEAPPVPVPVPEAEGEGEVEGESEGEGEGESLSGGESEASPAPAAVLDEDGVPVVDPALRAAQALGEGPWLDDSIIASTAGMLGDGEGEVLALVDHQRRTFVLVSAPGGRPEYAGRHGDEMSALWLIRVRAGTEDGEPVFRREAGVRLYDRWVPSATSDSATCNVASEVRARDLDGDGEVELTVLAAGGAEPDSSACGSVAFLIGADDLSVQARFTREHRYESYPAGSEIVLADDTTWVLRDVNGDGHGDLHVVQRYAYRNDFMGDWVGDGTMPASHERLGDRREVDCLWDAATDTWPCPAVEGYVLGSRLFYDPATTDARALERIASAPPWTPAR